MFSLTIRLYSRYSRHLSTILYEAISINFVNYGKFVLKKKKNLKHHIRFLKDEKGISYTDDGKAAKKLCP